jgi:hypothetical protein
VATYRARDVQLEVPPSPLEANISVGGALIF